MGAFFHSGWTASEGHDANVLIESVRYSCNQRWGERWVQLPKPYSDSKLQGTNVVSKEVLIQLKIWAGLSFVNRFLTLNYLERNFVCLKNTVIWNVLLKQIY